MEQQELKYLKLLAEKFPTIQEVCTEIINLKAIQNLPKSTEHFLSDLHGEYESFLHILKNASGVIKTKIDENFEYTMTSSERRKFATLIYYPEEKLKLLKEENKDNLYEYYKITLYRLIKLCKVVASKYSRSKVRKAMPKGYEYIIDELLHGSMESEDKETYYTQIIESIIKLGRAEAFIIEISKLIQQLSIDHLHIIGDIYDRGPGPDIIIDKLMKYHSIDIEWGNHDIVWMGAACGNAACIMNVIRICARYGNLSILEEGYGINIRKMTEFAKEQYTNKVESIFHSHTEEFEKGLDIELMGKMEKAAAIMQFKLEAEIIKRHPEYEMEDRLLLDKINFEDGTIDINGYTYKLLDTEFPTIDEDSPYELSPKEKEVVEKLVKSFKNSEKLQKHINFLYTKGSIYKIYNQNLLIHGCVPMNDLGELVEVEFENKKLKGKEYLDYIDEIARKAFYLDEGEEKTNAMDFMWYLWCGKYSPIFCKNAMKTFERYFLEDKNLRKEIKNPFYEFAQDEKVCKSILKEFGINKEEGRIIGGHMPVKLKDGESPIKANGKLLIIDGGLSKPYQKTTGIAGYTLIYNSYGLLLTAHEPFTSTEDAIINETDIHSTKQIVEKVERKKIADTDIGKKLEGQIQDLNKLLEAYKTGKIKQEE